MARKKRLSPNQLADLKDDFAGLKTIQDYAPAKNEFKVATVQAVDNELDALLEGEAQAKVTLDNFRDRIADKGTEYTVKMKGVRQQVVAQYGDDSPEYEAVGGTRISNRRTGLRRGKGGNGDTPTG